MRKTHLEVLKLAEYDDCPSYRVKMCRDCGVLTYCVTYCRRVNCDNSDCQKSRMMSIYQRSLRCKLNPVHTYFVTLTWKNPRLYSYRSIWEMVSTVEHLGVVTDANYWVRMQKKFNLWRESLGLTQVVRFMEVTEGRVKGRCNPHYHVLVQYSGDISEFKSKWDELVGYDTQVEVEKVYVKYKEHVTPDGRKYIIRGIPDVEKFQGRLVGYVTKYCAKGHKSKKIYLKHMRNIQVYAKEKQEVVLEYVRERVCDIPVSVVEGNQILDVVDTSNDIPVEAYKRSFEVLKNVSPGYYSEISSKVKKIVKYRRVLIELSFMTIVGPLTEYFVKCPKCHKYYEWKYEAIWDGVSSYDVQVKQFVTYNVKQEFMDDVMAFHFMETLRKNRECKVK